MNKRSLNCAPLPLKLKSLTFSVNGSGQSRINNKHTPTNLDNRITSNNSAVKKINKQLARKTKREHKTMAFIIVKQAIIAVQTQREPTRVRQQFRLAIEREHKLK